MGFEKSKILEKVRKYFEVMKCQNFEKTLKIMPIAFPVIVGKMVNSKNLQNSSLIYNSLEIVIEDDSNCLVLSVVIVVN